MRIKGYISVFVILLCLSSTAQFKVDFVEREGALKLLQKNMFSPGYSDAERITANETFKGLFQEALLRSGSFNFPFDSLKEIGRIYSPDKAFRLITWDIPMKDGTHQYYGFVQAYDPKTKLYVVHELIDKSADVKTPESYAGTPDKWFGMLYYKIIPVKYKKKKYYTLLGFDGNDNLTAKKFIDVLYFNESTVPKFGADIFKMEKRSSKRIVFEYSSKVVMTLKYNEDKNVIIYDHLAPSAPQFEGQYQFYGPDFSFDGLKFDKGSWTYIPDFDAKNPDNIEDNKYNDPKGNPEKKGDGFEKKIYQKQKQEPK